MNHSGYLTQFQKGTSRDASKHGRNAGTAVFVQKGSTLKVMHEFNIQGKQTSFYKYCPGTFGYTLVYLPVHHTQNTLNLIYSGKRASFMPIYNIRGEARTRLLQVNWRPI